MGELALTQATDESKGVTQEQQSECRKAMQSETGGEGVWAGGRDGSLRRGGMSGDGVGEGPCGHLEEEEDCKRGAARANALRRAHWLDGRCCGGQG